MVKQLGSLSRTASVSFGPTDPGPQPAHASGHVSWFWAASGNGQSCCIVWHVTRSIRWHSTQHPRCKIFFHALRPRTKWNAAPWLTHDFPFSKHVYIALGNTLAEASHQIPTLVDTSHFDLLASKETQQPRPAAANLEAVRGATWTNPTRAGVDFPINVWSCWTMGKSIHIYPCFCQVICARKTQQKILFTHLRSSQVETQLAHHSLAEGEAFPLDFSLKHLLRLAVSKQIYQTLEILFSFNSPQIIGQPL